MEETDVETESVIGREATPDDAPKPKKAKPSQTTSSRYAHLMISDSSASFDSPEGGLIGRLMRMTNLQN